MNDNSYNLKPGENIILKTSGVWSNSLGSNQSDLILTNERIICIQYKAFSFTKAVKSMERIELSDVRQAIVGRDSMKEPRLEIYTARGNYTYRFSSDQYRNSSIWAMAVADQLSEDADIYDFAYYQKFSQEEVERVMKEMEAEEAKPVDGGNLVNDIARDVLATGDFSIRGIKKGLKKAAKRQMGKPKENEWVTALKDEFGITEIQDEFIEIGNEFREEFGLTPKPTHKDMREMKLDKAFERIVNTVRSQTSQEQRAPEHEMREESADKSTGNSFADAGIPLGERIQAVKDLMELKELGAITEAEFDMKKRELLGL